MYTWSGWRKPGHLVSDLTPILMMIQQWRNFSPFAQLKAVNSSMGYDLLMEMTPFAFFSCRAIKRINSESHRRHCIRKMWEGPLHYKITAHIKYTVAAPFCPCFLPMGKETKQRTDAASLTLVKHTTAATSAHPVVFLCLCSKRLTVRNRTDVNCEHLAINEHDHLQPPLSFTFVAPFFPW